MEDTERFCEYICALVQYVQWAPAAGAVLSSRFTMTEEVRLTYTGSLIEFHHDAVDALCRPSNRDEDRAQFQIERESLYAHIGARIYREMTYTHKRLERYPDTAFAIGRFAAQSVAFVEWATYATPAMRLAIVAGASFSEDALTLEARTMAMRFGANIVE